MKIARVFLQVIVWLRGCVGCDRLLTGLFLLAHLMAPHVAHFLHAALQRRRNPEAAGSAIDESARALRERGAGCWQGPPNRQSPDTAAGAPAERPKLSSKGLKLMLAFASRLGSHRRGKENSATDCAIVVALSCVLYCFQQLSRSALSYFCNALCVEGANAVSRVFVVQVSPCHAAKTWFSSLLRMDWSAVLSNNAFRLSKRSLCLQVEAIARCDGCCHRCLLDWCNDHPLCAHVAAASADSTC